MKTKLAIASLVLLSGCATLSNPDNFAKCAAADVVSTAYGLGVNHMHEIDPLLTHLAIPSLGRVLGTVVPLIGVSIVAYYIVKGINNPIVTATATVVTCAAAVRNVYLSTE